MKKVFFASVFLVAFLMNATTAYADGIDIESPVTGSKVNSHIVQKIGKTTDYCTKENMPVLEYYLDTPWTSTAYSDYLEDLGHWDTVTPYNCKITPESMP